MSTFDPYSDSPFKIKQEGQEIVVHQNRLSPTTIRVSWSLPRATSCDIPLAYNGAIVTLDQAPTSLDKLPVDGTIYKSDNTADVNLHAGDRIGAALVVGAFYDDVTTTYVDITDAPTTGSYYISIHAVDKVHRYHTDGVHSYSLPFGKKQDEPEAGYQVIKMGVAGIQSTSLTGLSPTKEYTFTIKIDDIKPDPTIKFFGSEALTYGDLVDLINYQLVTSVNPTISTTVPNLGSVWVNTSTRTVSIFNGTSYDVQDNVIVSALDPMNPQVGATWFDPKNNILRIWDGSDWIAEYIHVFPRDPRNPFCNDYWSNVTNGLIYKWNGGAWIEQKLIRSTMDPALAPILSCGNYWYHDDTLFQWDEATCTWKEIPLVTVAPTNPTSGDSWFDLVTLTVQVWDSIDAAWVSMPTFTGAVDPRLPVVLAQGTVWFDAIDGNYYKLDGTSWVKIDLVSSRTKPQTITDGAYWFNTHDKFFYKMQMGLWTRFSPFIMETVPNYVPVGYYWYNPSNLTLQQWDGLAWNPILYSPTSQLPAVGAYWYNPTTKELFRWTGKAWALTAPVGSVEIDADGNLRMTSGTKGSPSWMCLSSAGNLWNSVGLTPLAMPQQPVKGTDPVTGVPSYLQLGVGTDGSQDERRAMVSRIKGVLGYPVIEVELTKAQMDYALDMAFEKLRSASSSGYKRGYFALDLQPRVQHYKLTDITVGFNKVVDIFYIYRMQATFLGTAQGNSVYGQMAIQQLFNMGKFDLLSYHMVSSYIKTMQQLFAAEIQFGWDEYTRTLSIMKDFPIGEKVLVDAMIEKTEQELLVDRWTRNWIQKYATAQCRYMLAGIRGKFSTLPGAGGNISLNASDLTQRADQEIVECMAEIDDFVVNNKTDFGVATDFVLG